jgi:hypothetical protein
MASAAHKIRYLWLDILQNWNELNGIGLFDEIKSYQLNTLLARDDPHTALFDLHSSRIQQVGLGEIDKISLRNSSVSKEIPEDVLPVECY